MPTDNVARRKAGHAAATVPMPAARRSPILSAIAIRRAWATHLPLPLMILIGLAFAVWEAAHVRGYVYATWEATKWSPYDEGVYLVSARALNHGGAIFSDVFSSQPPLFLGLLSFALRLANNAAGAGHLYSLACGLLALAGVAWLCGEIAGRWSALLGTAVLALSPGFVIAARAIEAEAPMLGFGSLCVASAARYAARNDRRWLLFASLLLAAATLSKLLAVSLIAPLLVALIIASAERDWKAAARRLILDGTFVVLCTGLPILAAFLLLSPTAQYDQVIRFHLHASDIYSHGTLVTDNGAMFSSFLSWDPGLLALAVVGVAVAAVTRRRLTALPMVWLLGTLATLVRYHPLFIHHLTVLLAPLAALAGIGAGALDWQEQIRWRRILAAGLLVIGLLAYAIWLPTIVRHSAHAFVTDTNPTNAALANWLHGHSRPTDLVVVDDQTLAVAAGRDVPGPLVDTSIVRAKAGYLPLSLLEQETALPRVRAVLLSRELLGDPAYVQYVSWLRAYFQQVPLPSGLPGLAFVPRQ